MLFVLACVVFFFKQKTAYEMRISDWSSDVCSSDLLGGTVEKLRPPSRDLVRMNVELLRQLRQRLLATDRRQGHLRLERPTVVPSGTSRHLVLLSRGILAAFRQEIHLRSEEHTSELQSLMRISYAVFCLKKKNTNIQHKS